MTEDLRIPKKQIEFTGKLFDYKEFRKYSDTFIETGNAAGDGLQRAVDAKFKSIYGIEASKYYFDMCKKRFNTNDTGHVHIYNYISVEGLIYLNAIINYKSVFYLDAHVSGDTSFGYEDWVKNGEESESAQDKTIKAELNIILSNYPKHVICIDDVNGLTDGHAEEYMEQCLLVNPEYKFRFYDEQLDSKGPRYKDKILVAIP